MEDTLIDNSPDDPYALRCGHNFSALECPYRHCGYKALLQISKTQPSEIPGNKPVCLPPNEDKKVCLSEDADLEDVSKIVHCVDDVEIEKRFKHWAQAHKHHFMSEWKDGECVDYTKSSLARAAWFSALSAWGFPPKRESGWLPIESAPKDGTPIMLLCTQATEDHRVTPHVVSYSTWVMTSRWIIADSLWSGCAMTPRMWMSKPKWPLPSIEGRSS